MCYGCWEEAGKPAIVTPATRAAALLVKRVYEFNGVGGNLHIATDDWNLEDDNIAFCRERVTRKLAGDVGDGYAAEPELLAAETACLDALEPMSEDERYSVLAIQSGFIEAGA